MVDGDIGGPTCWVGDAARRSTKVGVCMCVVVIRQLASRCTGCRSRGKTVTEDCGGGGQPATSVGIILLLYSRSRSWRGDGWQPARILYILTAATYHNVVYTA